MVSYKVWRFLEHVEVEWGWCLFGADVEIITIVDYVSVLVIRRNAWLDCEPAILSSFSQIGFTAAIFLAHFVQIQSQILAWEQMFKLEGWTVCQFATKIEFLLVIVILCLNSLTLLVFVNIFLDLFKFIFELVHNFLVFFAAWIYNHFSESVLSFDLLLKKFLSS